MPVTEVTIDFIKTKQDADKRYRIPNSLCLYT